MSGNADGKENTAAAETGDAVKPDAPLPSKEPAQEKPNYMADVLARHERISNRVNSKK